MMRASAAVPGCAPPAAPQHQQRRRSSPAGAGAPRTAASAAPPALSSSDPKRWWNLAQKAGSAEPASSASSKPGTWQHGGLAPPAADLPAAVAPLAAACGADAAQVTRAVGCLPAAMRAGVLAHGCDVAQHLEQLGCPPAQRAAALRRCLPLFAHPPGERAAALIAQLMAAGLSAPEAVSCFQAHPPAASCASLEPGLQAVAALLTGGAEQPAERQQQPAVAALLQEQPAAAALLTVSPHELQRRADHLQQAYGLPPSQLAAALRRDAQLLTLAPEQLEEQEAALAEELGTDRGAFARLLCCRGGPGVLAFLAHCVEELQHSARAVQLEFGQEAAAAMVLDAPELLSDGAATWRRALDTLRLLWVPDPAALARRAPRLLCADLAGPACVASRLVLQYSFGLPAAAVYERLPGSALAPPEELACRLSFLEMQGLPVAAAAAGPEEGLAEGAAAAAISLEEVAALPERTLLQRLEQLAAACRQAWAGAAAFAAFRSSFQQRPEWAHLQAEAAAESARLQRLLRGA